MFISPGIAESSQHHRLVRQLDCGLAGGRKVRHRVPGQRPDTGHRAAFEVRLLERQVPVPALTGHITDLTGTLSVAQKASLEQALTEFEAGKGSQLTVLMVATTAPEEIEQFSLRVAEQWKLGRKRSTTAPSS